MAEQGWAANVVVTPGAAPGLARRPSDGNHEKHLAIIPMDMSGNVRLTQDLRARLELPSTVAPPTSDHFIAPGPQGATLARRSHHRAPAPMIDAKRSTCAMCKF
jgi:hypothetical protein